MTATITAENHVQAGPFFGRVHTLPISSSEEENKQGFEEVCAECNAVPLDTFIDELKARIEKWPDHA